MKAYLIIKFDTDRNRKRIGKVCDALEKARFSTTVMVRDYEKWGKVTFSPKKLMQLSFRIIRESDIVVAEFSEKGVGVGIEAGYAFSKGKPIIVVAKKGSDISATVKGIAKKVFIYNNPKSLIPFFRKIKKN